MRQHPARPAKPRPQPAPVEVPNDLNGDLVTLCPVLQNHLKEFVRQFNGGSAPGRSLNGGR